MDGLADRRSMQNYIRIHKEFGRAGSELGAHQLSRFTCGQDPMGVRPVGLQMECFSDGSYQASGM